ncbi:MAG: TonB-dependent receptor, partial [Bacteroidota bacterium]
QRQVSLGDLSLTPEIEGTGKGSVTDEDRIPVVTLSGDEEESELSGQNVSGLLSASQDVFVRAAAFNLSTGGFEIRGYDNEAAVFFNGIHVNNLETGAVYYGTWGGLNDVTRNRESSTDLTPIPFSFGGIGGATSIDTRASEQRKQTRLTYMFSNRSYTGRLMGTFSTGWLPSGWAFSFSGSKRWAEEGYVPGTFYDAYSYFGSIDKKLGNKHLLNLTALGAPTRRGSQGASTREAVSLADGRAFDPKWTWSGEPEEHLLSGNNFYNPNWGYQAGKKRNARVVNSHQPMVILRHDWKLSDKASLTTAAGHIFGKYGRTSLDWFNAPDPRPDYYRKLPSYYAIQNQEVADQVQQLFLENPNLLQIQWDDLYNANRNNGQSWNGEPGTFSQYVIADQRSDLQRYSATSSYQNIVSDNLTVNFGLTFQRDRGHYFSTLEDLLGGDYFVNIDRFALDTPLPGQLPGYNLENEDVIVREGDTYRWDYYLTGLRYGTWLQGQFRFRKLDFFVAGEVTKNDFWRTGNFRNGRFPDNSFGDSEKQNYLNYSAKGGVTYKINGRNYLYANAAWLDRAPDLRVAYVSPRSRDQLVPGLTKEQVYSFEGGYQLRSPNFKARATFFLTQFNNGLKLNRFYLAENVTQFGTSILSGVDSRHAGIEAAIQWKISPTLTASGVAAVGEYVYTSRPEGYFVIDDDGKIEALGTIYAKNFYVPSTPQTAYSATLDYRSASFWSASVTVNYFDRNYLDFNPFRRRTEAVFNTDEGSELYNRIVNQQKLPDAFTVDLFGNKSWRINDGTFFNLTAG